VALTEMNIGNVLSAQGDNENALLRYKKALSIQEVALGPSHASVAQTKQNIGIVHHRKGDPTAAKLHYKEAYEIYLNSLGPDHPSTQGLAPYI
jgi:tetratricopeptide (TPR) repeat protein